MPELSIKGKTIVITMLVSTDVASSQILIGLDLITIFDITVSGLPVFFDDEIFDDEHSSLGVR